jgi:hypothetical protein
MKRRITARVVRHATAVIIAASSIGAAVTLAAAPSASATSIAIHTTHNTGPEHGTTGNPWG